MLLLTASRGFFVKLMLTWLVIKYYHFFPLLHLPEGDERQFNFILLLLVQSYFGKAPKGIRNLDT